jgi:serine protease Do
MGWTRAFPAMIAVALAGAPALAKAEPMFKSDADLVAAVLPSVVNIYQRHAETPMVMKDGKEEAAGPRIIHDEVGSGFIVDPSGIIVTNRHVIEDAYALFVTLSDGRHFPAKLLGKALAFDIALIKIDVGQPLPIAKIGDSEKMRVGDAVVAIGNPLGFANSASSGIISAFHRDVGLSAFDDLMQTDATINQGNSGGPLFNKNGEVIGINEAIYTRNAGGSIGIGFSIPVNQAKFLIDSVKQYGKPHIGWIGVTGQTFTPGMAAALGSSADGGVIISALAPNSPAGKAGLMVGDAILRIGDTKIWDVTSLNREVARLLDKDAPFRIFRNGAEMTLPVKIEQWPDELWSNKMPEPPTLETPADFGITFSSAPGDHLVVADVAPKSIAWSAGMRPGDMILKIQRAEIHNDHDMMVAVKELHTVGKETAAILLGGPNGTRWIEFSVQE